MVYGENSEKGLVLEGLKLKVVTIGEDGYTIDDILTHDAQEQETTLHTMLAAMKYPEYPVALGVIRSVEAPVYDEEVAKQIESVKESAKIKSMSDLLTSGETWTIE